MRLALRGLAATLISAGALAVACGDEFREGKNDPSGGEAGEAGETSGGGGTGGTGGSVSSGGTGGSAGEGGEPARGGTSGSAGEGGEPTGDGGASASAGEGGEPTGGMSGSDAGGSDPGGSGGRGGNGGAGAGSGGISGSGGSGGAGGTGGRAGSGGASGTGGSGGSAGGDAGAGGTSGAGAGGTAGSGGAGTGGAGTGGAGGTAGSGGAGGACLIPATESVWPDSPTAFCSNGSLATACSNALGAAFGQDGNYQGPSNRYVKTNGVTSDSLLGLEWTSAFTGPETHGNAASHCNNLVIDVRDDWRLPTRLELLSTHDYGRSDPVFDTSVFDAPTGTFRSFWTRNVHASSGADHWVVHAEGTLLARADILATMVRCVRGPVFASMLAEVAGCSIIHDPVTGLGWQKYASGQVLGWTGALQHCESSQQDGFHDWRLPSVKELETIVNPTMLNPAVDANLFPGTPVELFWTSTPYVDNPANAWAVDFWDGAAVHDQPTSTPLRVRCVRGGSTALR